MWTEECWPHCDHCRSPFENALEGMQEPDVNRYDVPQEEYAFECVKSKTAEVSPEDQRPLVAIPLPKRGDFRPALVTNAGRINQTPSRCHTTELLKEQGTDSIRIRASVLSNS